MHLQRYHIIAERIREIRKVSNMRDCENCIRNIPGQGCTSWDCEYINRLEAIETYERSQWIPVSEKPEAGLLGKDYLVYTKHGFGLATYFPNGKWLGYDVHGDSFDEKIILAWMPLPNDYRGE